MSSQNMVRCAALCALLHISTAFCQDPTVRTLEEITVTAPEPVMVEVIPEEQVSRKSSYVSDSAQLLQDTPGVSVYGAGGVSSLPVVHGLADDRLRIKVDGMDLIPACPNHMNSPLSYVDPTSITVLKVYTGISPVSLGGDSIGAVIIADTKGPAFAEQGKRLVTTGEVGARYRSNGGSGGLNAAINVANTTFSLNYSVSAVESDNYTAGDNFKDYKETGRPGHDLALDEVGSSAYRAMNHVLGVAFRSGAHLFETRLGYQKIPEELYPNQRMDMLDNEAKRVNLRYLGQMGWGGLEARAYYERVDHFMDFGKDKKSSYGVLAPPNTTGATYPVDGMPMYTRGETAGLGLRSGIEATAKNLVHVGIDMQAYRLDDWWPPVPDCGYGNCVGGMAPLTFWNINGGERDRLGIYGELETKISKVLQTVVGIRGEIVRTDTGEVVGYNTSMTPLSTGFMKNMYETSSVGTRDAFNARDRERFDYNIDWALLSRYVPGETATFEFGVSQKTRSPNLYERYSWSRNVMALEMNNFVGDGNGYLGDPNLDREIGYTASVTGNFHSKDRKWEVRVTPYFTYVSDYVDAVQWNRSTNVPASPTVVNQFVVMKYVNQSARIAGLDISGSMALGSSALGDFGLSGFASYTNGENRETHDDLYNVMPLQGRVVLTHKLGGWDNAVEVIGVMEKNGVSEARNETATDGYALLHYRANYTWRIVRIDFGVENILDALYFHPQGGAYTGQGATMSFNREIGAIGPNGGTKTMWGTAVPGRGRSLYAGLTIEF
jgi:iron complex outermembrane recepter protein